MEINPVNSSVLKEIGSDLAEMRAGASAGAGPTGEVKDSGFGAMLEKSLADVNSLLQTADKKSVDLATGKSENLHEAMISFEKAETALKLMMQTRNKALEAYHEIMRMQV